MILRGSIPPTRHPASSTSCAPHARLPVSLSSFPVVFSLSLFLGYTHSRSCILSLNISGEGGEVSKSRLSVVDRVEGSTLFPACPGKKAVSRRKATLRGSPVGRAARGPRARVASTRRSLVKDREERVRVLRVPTFEPQAASYEFTYEEGAVNCVLQKEQSRVRSSSFLDDALRREFRLREDIRRRTGECSFRCASDESLVCKWHFYVQVSRKVSAHAAPLMSPGGEGRRKK